jgi:heme oxygenase
MYSNWLYDQEEMHKMAHHYTTYLGAFSNHELYNKIMENNTPQHKSSGDSFDESFNAIDSMNDEKLLAAQQIIASKKSRKVIK